MEKSIASQSIMNEQVRLYEQLYSQLAAFKHIVFTCTGQMIDAKKLALLLSGQISEKLHSFPNAVWLTDDKDQLFEAAVNGKLPENQQPSATLEQERFQKFTDSNYKIIRMDDLTENERIALGFQSPTVFLIRMKKRLYGLLVIDHVDDSSVDIFQFCAQFAALILNMLHYHQKLENQQIELKELNDLFMAQHMVLSGLHHISLKIGSINGHEELFQVLTNNAVTDLGAKRAAYFSLSEKDPRQLVFRSQYGGFEKCDPIVLEDATNKIFKQTIDTGRIISCLDFPDECKMGFNVLNDWMLFPIKSKLRIFGLLIVETNENDLNDPLAILSSYASIAIEKLNNLNANYRTNEKLESQLNAKNYALGQANINLNQKIDELEQAKTELKSKIDEVEYINQIMLEQNEQIVAIQRIIGNLGRMLSFEDIGTAIITALKDDLNLPKLVLSLKEEDDLFGFIKTIGFADLNIKTAKSLMLNDKAISRVLASGRILMKTDFNNSSNFCDPNFEEWMVWPIKRKGEIIGLLIINDPGGEKRDSVGVLINQSSVLFDNAILYENLITTGKRLRELDHQKSEFLHMLGHDLRTPLTSIKSYCEMLLMYKDEPWETQEEFLSIIKKESERLTTLVNNFLDLSKVDIDLDKLKKITFPVAPLFDHFISLYKEESQRRDICFTKIITPNLPDIFADKYLITQVMANLMSNAIKYTPTHGKIHLEAKISNADCGIQTKSEIGNPKSKIEISVANTGPDIPIVYQEMIFEKFGQAKNRLVKHKGGTGLGLPVARDIIERHNGKIWIESAPEKGVKFFFTLPLEENDRNLTVCC